LAVEFHSIQLPFLDEFIKTTENENMKTQSMQKKSRCVGIVFGIYITIALCCLQTGCGEQSRLSAMSEAKESNWEKINYHPEYILVTAAGRERFLGSINANSIKEVLGDENFIFINGVPVLTVRKDFFDKFLENDDGKTEVIYFYKALTKEGLEAAGKIFAAKIESGGPWQKIFIREKIGVCHIIYYNEFLFNCSLHPQYLSNAPGSCPLCSLPLKIMAAPKHP
jgi:hypothetical protein